MVSISVQDYLTALEWDSTMHTRGHVEAGTSAVDCEDENCPLYGRNTPLPVGTHIRLPEDNSERG